MDRIAQYYTHNYKKEMCHYDTWQPYVIFLPNLFETQFFVFVLQPAKNIYDCVGVDTYEYNPESCLTLCLVLSILFHF